MAAPIECISKIIPKIRGPICKLWHKSSVQQLSVCCRHSNANYRSPKLSYLSPSVAFKIRHFNTTSRVSDLMEFFDVKSNWGENIVKTGRPWRKDELRIKSNVDLHKLWYVLLKERNMLMTMEAEYKRLCELFPSPERIFKVEESMENLLEVVAERDRCVNLLETGKTGEPEMIERRNFFGLPHRYRAREYRMPREINRVHNILYPPHRKYMDKFVALYKEKLLNDERRKVAKRRRYLTKLKEQFPHAEID